MYGLPSLSPAFTAGARGANDGSVSNLRVVACRGAIIVADLTLGDFERGKFVKGVSRNRIFGEGGGEFDNMNCTNERAEGGLGPGEEGGNLSVFRFLLLRNRITATLTTIPRKLTPAIIPAARYPVQAGLRLVVPSGAIEGADALVADVVKKLETGALVVS
jgi:hypothetical protein